MTVSLLEAARLLQWASQGGRDLGGEQASKGGALPGWHWMENKDDPASGFNAVTFKKGLEVVVAIKGQLDNRQVKGWARLRAHWVDLRESIRRQWLPGPYVYPSVGIDYVRKVVERFPHANVVLIGHSSGSGWASAIAAQLRLKAIGFGGGYQALRTNEHSNNPESISVEIEGDPYGDSFKSKRLFRPKRHRLRCPPGYEKPRIKRHLIGAYIAALERENANH